MNISVIIPALNEATSIAQVIRSIPRPPATEIVVVDNGSTDGTGALASAAGARVVREERRGYAGRDLFCALIRYGETWEFNASVFSLLGGCIASRGVRNAIVFGVLGALAVWLCRRELELSDQMFLLLGALFVVTPVLYPWYLIWIVPFLALRSSAAWIYLTAGSFLSYRILPAYLETEVWQERISTRLLEYVPFYLLLASGPLMRWMRSRKAQHEPGMDSYLNASRKT